MTEPNENNHTMIQGYVVPDKIVEAAVGVISSIMKDIQCDAATRLAAAQFLLAMNEADRKIDRPA